MMKTFHYLKDMPPGPRLNIKTIFPKYKDSHA